MIDMTKGRPLPLIVRFAVPIILSNLFMMLYTMADSMIVGQWLGPEAFAAIGAAGYLYDFPRAMDVRRYALTEITFIPIDCIVYITNRPWLPHR